MKENSAEEDIVKKFEEFCEDIYIFKDDDMGGHFEGVVGDQIANTKLGYLIFKEKLEDFLSDYKRVLKDNEEFKRLHIQDNKHLDFIMQHSIPAQKVKDKIEHYQKLQDNYIEKYDEINEGLQAMINALQELLEGRK